MEHGAALAVLWVVVAGAEPDSGRGDVCPVRVHDRTAALVTLRAGYPVEFSDRCCNLSHSKPLEPLPSMIGPLRV